jgi:hypothetical protein
VWKDKEKKKIKGGKEKGERDEGEEKKKVNNLLISRIKKKQN